MTYTAFLDELKGYAEPSFAVFQKRLIFTHYEILGVRTPTLRKLAKEHARNLDEIFVFPNEYYEVVFIKLAIVASLPYEEFVAYLTDCVRLIDNWGLCDSFKAKAVAKHKEAFLSEIERIFAHGGEYFERYALVALLANYVELSYIPVIESYLNRADTSAYYVYMAAAWLIAEVLIKDYADGVRLLKSGVLDEKTRDKAIQKAIESYRLTKEEKEFLRSLKSKKKKAK